MFKADSEPLCIDVHVNLNRKGILIERRFPTVAVDDVFNLQHLILKPSTFYVEDQDPGSEPAGMESNLECLRRVFENGAEHYF